MLLHPERLESAHPLLKEFVPQLADRMEKVLHRDLLVTEGLRTDDRQDTLYAQGRTEPGEIVTNARAGESAHNPGSDGAFYAVDLVAVDKATGKAIWSDTPSFDFIGAEANKFGGLHWGGDFKSIKDKPHVEVAGWKELRGSAGADLVAESAPEESPAEVSKPGGTIPGWAFLIMPAAQLTGYFIGRVFG